MRFIKSISLLLLFFGVIFNVSSQIKETGSPIIVNYSPKQYNAHDQNFAIVQDSVGVIYIGNGDGILEYDGIHFNLIELANKTNIYSFYKDKNQRIYYGAVGEFGYLYKNMQGKTLYKSLTSLLPDSINISKVWQIEGIDEKIFFRTSEYLLVYCNNEITVYQPKNRFSIIFKINNTIYLRDKDIGLYQFKKDKLIEAPYFKKFQSIYAIWYAQNQNKEVYLGHNVLYKYNPTDSLLVKIESKITDIFKEYWGTCGIQINDTLYAVGTSGDGIYVLSESGKIVEHINNKNGLLNSFIQDFYLDKNGTLWVATNKGISSIAIKKSIRLWNKRDDIKTFVQKFIRYNGTLYAALFDGVYYLNHSNFVHIEGNTKEVFDFIEWINPDTKEKHLFCGLDFGVFEIVNKNFKSVFEFDFNVYVFDFHQSITDNRRLFLAHYNGISSLYYKKNKWIDEGYIEGIKTDIRKVIEDKNGNLWLGTFRNGIIRIINPKKKNQIIEHYDQTANLPGLKNVLPFKIKNKIVFGTENGLYIFNEDKKKFQKDTCLGNEFGFDNTIYNLIEDNKSNILYSGLQNKNTPITYAVQESACNYKVYNNRLKIIPEMMVLTIYPESDGTIWIGGSEGIYKFSNKNLIKNINIPKTLIRKIILNNDSVLFYSLPDEYKKVKIKKKNSIKIMYSVSSYTQKNKNLYRYKLLGYNNNWTEWTSEFYKEYTNLSCGKYQFIVQAKTYDNIVCQEDSFNFQIQYPWYLKWYMIVFYLYFTFLFIYFLLYYFTKRLKEKNKKLESIINERTKNLNERNAELKLQKEKIEIQAKIIEKQSKRRFRLYFENSPLGIYIIDYDGNYIRANKLGFKLLGIKSNNELKSFNFINIFGDKAKDFLRSITNKGGARDEFLYAENSNSNTYLRINAVVINFKELLLFKEDITDIKLAEESLRISEKKFSSIFNRSNDSFVISDMNQNIIDANSAALKKFDYKKNEILELKTTDLVRKDYVKRVNKRLEKLKTSNVGIEEMVGITKTGKEIAIELNSTILKLYDSYVLISIVRDISERKAAERELLKAIINTEEKERKRFSEDLHDELGPFLSGIKLYINVLDDNELEKQRRTELAKYLNQIIDEAIVKTKTISNNMRPSVLSDFGFAKSIRTFVDKVKMTNTLNVAFATNNLKPKYDDLIEVILYRISIELINNTLKHAKASEIKLNLFEKNDILYLQYSDNGVGFDLKKYRNKNSGMGMQNIQNRLKSINGILDFKTSLNNGVNVKIEINLKNL